MRIAYGTYAMPTVPLEEAFPALAEIGYDGVEICISPKHIGAMPDEMDAGRRARLRAGLTASNLGVPALFITGALWTRDAAQKAATMDHLRTCAQLARDLGVGDTPVLAMGIGGKRDEWDDIRDDLVALLGEYADLVGGLAPTSGPPLALIGLGKTGSFPTDDGPLTADFTGDGAVDFSDFLTFASGFGKSSSDPDFDPRLDLDGNGRVDFSDFLTFASQFGRRS